MVAVAERMLEYTLDVVKLEPADTKCLAKTALVENKCFITSLEMAENKGGKQSCAAARSPLESESVIL